MRRTGGLISIGMFSRLHSSTIMFLIVPGSIPSFAVRILPFFSTTKTLVCEPSNSRPRSSVSKTSCISSLSSTERSFIQVVLLISGFSRGLPLIAVMIGELGRGGKRSAWQYLFDDRFMTPVCKERNDDNVQRAILVSKQREPLLLLKLVQLSKCISYNTFYILLSHVTLRIRINDTSRVKIELHHPISPDRSSRRVHSVLSHHILCRHRITIVDSHLIHIITNDHTSRMNHSLEKSMERFSKTCV